MSVPEWVSETELRISDMTGGGGGGGGGGGDGKIKRLYWLAPEARAGEAGDLLVTGPHGVVDGVDRDSVVRLPQQAGRELPTAAVAGHLCPQM